SQKFNSSSTLILVSISPTSLSLSKCPLKDKTVALKPIHQIIPRIYPS
ncbi:unnamed protein product, partial [Allacma fusca]